MSQDKAQRKKFIYLLGSAPRHEARDSKMVGDVRFELTAPGFGGQYSIQLS